ncbi:hypothetical protein ERO13_D08G275050v2 [Gossypium hirsutum]|uniref:Uncharacterized protein n=2 Tax=Gossypium TaxID=3633 RepID=A0A5J5QKN0_GOSBA|nr:hypothetical protein ES319_D08G303600v1 [Gossypium barbadense]KAG4136343.1 hypothetical protein ERO13_D08G275050v2 [Gossypium hirsutum]TYH60721.1 hypothetical protein ES332_D08G314500v1 [Gossypium tomentosum]
MELCSFSPCIGQVQLHVKLRFDFTDHLKVNDGNSTTCPPRKRRQPSSEASVGDNASSPSVMAWPSAET